MPRKPPERIVVVTGASNGPGRAIALEFALHGEALVLGSRRSGPLDAVRRSCDALHGWTLAQTVDVADLDQAYALANAALARFKRIDIWINYAPPVPLLRGDATPVDAFGDGAAFDLQGYENGATAALACFEKLGGGVLINVDSLIGGAPPGCEERYRELRRQVAATFAGIEERARAVPGVRVCSVQPARTPASSERLAPGIVALARAWSKGGHVAGWLGAVERGRLALRCSMPARSRRGHRHEPVAHAPLAHEPAAATAGEPRAMHTADDGRHGAEHLRERRRGIPRRHGSWHLARVARSRELLSTALLVLVVPIMALAALMMVS